MQLFHPFVDCFVLQRASPLMQRFVPFVAVAAANMVNIPLTRQRFAPFPPVFPWILWPRLLVLLPSGSSFLTPDTASATSFRDKILGCALSQSSLSEYHHVIVIVVVVVDRTARLHNPNSKYHPRANLTLRAASTLISAALCFHCCSER